jgi:hypothetical protein
MSEELSITEDYLIKRHKEALETMKPQSMAKRSPKKWMLCARYILEDGLTPTDFMRKTGQTRNNYYDIKRFLETGDDYEQIRAKAALDAATDYEIGVDKGWAQIQRGQSLKADRFQKFSGAATQHVVVEHKTTLDEAAAFAAEAAKQVTEIEAEEVLCC